MKILSIYPACIPELTTSKCFANQLFRAFSVPTLKIMIWNQHLNTSKTTGSANPKCQYSICWNQISAANKDHRLISGNATDDQSRSICLQANHINTRMTSYLDTLNKLHTCSCLSIFYIFSSWNKILAAWIELDTHPFCFSMSIINIKWQQHI